MKYVAYSRKSSEGEDRQAQSLDTQERLLRDYASKNKLEIVRFIRESKSAKTDGNRPLFLEMLKYIQEGKADGILVVHTDRIARNFIDAGMIIKMLEKGLLKEVRTPSKVYDDYMSLFYMGFDFVFASHYSRDLSVKVKAGNESKILKGEYPTNAPLGYLNIPHGIVPDPIRASFVKRAFELYGTGELSLKSLTKELHNSGFTTKKGFYVNKSCIHRLLSNPEYLGFINRKGHLYRGNHQPLVSQTLFDKVQDILNNKHNSRKQKHNFLYRRFLSCSVCGCKITADIAKHKYVYYHCTNGKKVCDQHKNYLSENSVEELFKDFFKGCKIDKETASLSLELYKEELLNEHKLEDQSIKTRKNEISKIDNKIQKLVDMKLEEKIDEDLFKQTKERLLREKTELEKISVPIPFENIETTFELLDTIKIRACNLQKVFINGDSEVKKNLLDSVLSNCYIEDKKITKVNLNLPYRPILELGKSTDLKEWRRRWDSNPRGSFELRFSEPFR